MLDAVLRAYLSEVAGIQEHLLAYTENLRSSVKQLQRRVGR